MTTRKILHRLYEAGDIGLADHELAALCPTICTSTVRGGRKDLERNALCVRTGRTKQTSTGCYGYVYKITALGKQYIDTGRQLPGKQLPTTDDSLLRQIIKKIRQGNDFQCGTIEGEHKYYAGFSNGQSKRCNECDAPLLFQENLGIGITLEDAILRALEL